MQKRRERGRIDVRGIKLVEPAILHGDGGDAQAPNVSKRWDTQCHVSSSNFSDTQGYPFQVGYSELNCITGGNSTLPTFTLYLVSATDKERTEWIKAIRKGEQAIKWSWRVIDLQISI